MGMKIAIVGAGISGLTCAYLLQNGHDLTVFEAEPQAGGHSNTVTVDEPAGPIGIDTGFIVYNDRNYPNFERLLAQLGVATQPSSMSFAVTHESENFEFGGGSPNALFACRKHLVDRHFYRMVVDLMRFNHDAHKALKRGIGSDVTLGRFLADHNYSQLLIDRLITPQVSAVWSADPSQTLQFPASFMFQFFANHGMLGLRNRPNWRTITGGSRNSVDKLIEQLGARVQLGVPVASITRRDGQIELVPGSGAAERFDHVIMATHSDQALKLLADRSALESEILGDMPFQTNEAVLHTDSTLLPRHHAARSSWNFHILDQPKPRTTVTYWMNNLQNLQTQTDYMVTLNRGEAIDPAKVIAKFEYAHPVITPQSVAAQQRFGEISGVGQTHFCGAYWRWGFHEDGVVSALRACEKFGVTL